GRSDPADGDRRARRAATRPDDGNSPGATPPGPPGGDHGPERAGRTARSTGEEEPMRVTLRDVAEQAGVSVATVSRALSRPEMVSEESRDRIQEISLQLGYRHSRIPRELAPGSSGTLGVIVPDLLNPFYPALLKGAQS